ncbi:MAG: polysaccharide deacetylase family protein [Candidatus Sulfotelmatobacter sp.]
MLRLAIAAASAAAAVTAGYQTKSPTGQWYGRTFIGAPLPSRQLALTYDDGPNGPHTQRLLELLVKHNVPATFFLIGRYVKQLPQIVREISQAGHVIGNHTFTHPSLIFKGKTEIKRELTDCRAALEDTIGAHSNLFRPPFGSRRPAVLRIARELGFEPIMWNVTAYDWKPLSAAQIEHKASQQVRGGDVILLHDGGHQRLGVDRSQTLIATDHLLTHFKNEGFEFVTIPRMMMTTGAGTYPASSTRPQSLSS